MPKNPVFFLENITIIRIDTFYLKVLYDNARNEVNLVKKTSSQISTNNQ